tara:strand:- start:683 stop:1033 length:351 start_codon:yes stop_codon:yes gene_type:complete
MIHLVIQGLGHIGNFKNCKACWRNMLITVPRAKNQMRSIEKDFVSQLTSLYRTTEDETQTGQSIQSWIASSMPLDDSVREIAEIVVRVRRAPKGKEGAIVKLDKINKNEPRVQESN